MRRFSNFLNGVDIKYISEGADGKVYGVTNKGSVGAKSFAVKMCTFRQYTTFI
jgi:hypothetical protein